MTIAQVNLRTESEKNEIRPTWEFGFSQWIMTYSQRKPLCIEKNTIPVYSSSREGTNI